MSNIDGLTSSSDLRHKLEDYGFDDPMKVAVASPGELSNTLGIGESQAERLIEAAREQTTPVGFKSGTEVESPPDLTEADVVDEVEGWNIRRHTPDRISWTSPSDYSVVIKAVPTRGGDQPRTYEVRGILPPAGEHNPQQSKKEERVLKAEMDTVEEAVGYAVGWMETHPVKFEQDLTEFTGVSERTAEYLLLEHETKNHQQLYEFWKESTLEAVIGKQWHDELEEEMKRKFE